MDIEKLKQGLSKAKEVIEKAIFDKQLIILRHHNDCDGYTGASILHKIIYEKLQRQHSKDRDIFHYYKRMPCQAPYYSFEDSTKDINFIYDKNKHQNKEPLLIVVDNGSTGQDFEGLKRAKIFGFKVVVIDHHPHSEKTDAIIDVHVNPHLLSKDTKVSAGALCSVLAKLDNPNDKTFDFIACVSSIADMMEGQVYDNSFDNIKDDFSYDYLRSVGDAITYETLRAGFVEAWSNVQELLFNHNEARDKLLELDLEQNKKLLAKSLRTSEQYAKSTKTKNGIITVLEPKEIMLMREYPPFSKTVSILHKKIVDENQNSACITFGLAPDTLTIRANEKSTMDLNLLKSELNKKFEFAKIDGGGHALAGTLKFIPKMKEEILEFIKKKYDF